MWIFTWQMAEELAEGHMRAIGFPDAKRSARGPDAGIDVVASDAVAQVKYLAAPVGSPEVQKLRGVAHRRMHALFYSRSGYTAAALHFANEAAVALFTYDEAGEVQPSNDLAAALSKQSREFAWGPAEHNIFLALLEANDQDSILRLTLGDPVQSARWESYVADRDRALDMLGIVMDRVTELRKPVETAAEALMDSYTPLQIPGTPTTSEEWNAIVQIRLKVAEWSDLTSEHQKRTRDLNEAIRQASPTDLLDQASERIDALTAEYELLGLKAPVPADFNTRPA